MNFKQLTKNSIINYVLSSTKYLLIIIISTNLIKAQDLISESQAAIPPNQTLAPSQIFQDISTQQNTFNEVTPFKLSDEGTTILKSYKNLIDAGIVLEEQNNEFENIYNTKKQNIELKIPVGNNQYIILKLEKTNVFSEEFVFKYGDTQNNNTQDVVFYRGIVDKKPFSSAAITVTANSIRGVISDEYGNYIISYLNEHPNKYLLYNENALKSNIPFNGCGADILLPGKVAKTFNIEDGIKHTRKDLGDCVEIYIECDYSMYEEHNYSVNAVKEYVSALFNEVAIIYYNERINILLSELYVWTSPDPYRNLTNSYDLLDGFGAYRRNDYNGRLAHLLTYRSVGDGGRAWLDVLCESYYTYERNNETRHAGPYGVSTVISNTVTPFNTYSWDVFILSHELGHNFGSPHTHACKWGPDGDEALDNCWPTEDDCAAGPEPVNGGTIMSYCNTGDAFYLYGINFNNGFGTQPGDLIRSKVNSSNCLSECPCGTRSNKDASIFDNYSWLNGIVNLNECNNEVVTLYKKGSHKYIYVDDGSRAKLYAQDGLKYCTSSSTRDCISLYELSQVEASWACTAVNANCGAGGCTDADACNFDPRAEFNDGSCDYGAIQCPNPCSAAVGCTNPAATNYQSNATCDDGSCEFEEGCDADIFTTFNWLNDLVSQTNCTSEKITVFKKRIYFYVYIEYADEGVLYLSRSSGNSLYCTDDGEGRCVEIYDLIDLVKEWSCNGCDGNPPPNNGCSDTDLFNEYRWLNNLVDMNDCDDETVTKYNAKSNSFIYANTNDKGYLLYEDGDLACSDNGDKRCVNAYKLKNTGTCWSCGNNGQTQVFGCTNSSACNYNSRATVNDNSCDFGNSNCDNPCSPVPGCTDQNACNYDTDACVNDGSCEYESCQYCEEYDYTGEIFYRTCNGESYYLIELTNGTIVDPYNDTGISFDYPDGAIVNFNYRNYNLSNYCRIADKAVLVTCIEIAESNSDDSIFSEFPFLNSLVDNRNCDSDSYIEVYQLENYAYIFVNNGENERLYFEDGTRYCRERPNYNCRELYNLSNPTSVWNCRQGLAKLNSSKIPLDIDVFPNPNNGVFTLSVNDEIDFENSHLKIYNTSGQALLTLKHINQHNKIDLSVVGKGLYWIEFSTPNNSVVEKIIIK